MKIAFISPFICRMKRGIERYTMELANYLVELDNTLEIDIMTWKGPYPIQEQYRHNNIHIIEIPYSRYYQSKIAIPFYVLRLLKNNYDIVNIFFAGYGEMAALMITSLIKRQRFNVIFQYPATTVPFRYQEFKRWGFIDRADKIISTSTFIADGLRNFCGKESVVIHSGFDEKVFAPNLQARSRIRHELGLSEENKVILTVAALEERKGIHKIIDIMPLLRKKVPQVRYLVLGEGPYEHELKQRIQQLGVEENVLLLGVKNDPVPYYCAADLFALLSYGEASPLVIPEAMGCELPVVVSQQRPFDEIVNRNVAEIVDENDRQKVLDSIVTLLCNDSKRHEMGNAGRHFAVNNYRWNKIASAFYQLFSSQL